MTQLIDDIVQPCGLRHRYECNEEQLEGKSGELLLFQLVLALDISVPLAAIRRLWVRFSGWLVIHPQGSRHGEEVLQSRPYLVAVGSYAFGLNAR